MKLKIEANRLLQEMLNTDKRFILHIGGSRSGKTYSILQYLLVYCLKNKGKTVTIARKTFPSLRLGAMREFLEMLKSHDIYREEHHNKTNNFYTLNENIIQFISIDQSIKLRGLKHDMVFIDEVNEISKEEGDQLFMRTTGQIIMAQNPSDALHWSMKYQADTECLYLHSTYKDNPFLADAIVRQIESYKDTDIDQWNVYGLGLPAKNNELIYNHQEYYDDGDEYNTDDEGKKYPKYEDTVIGIDWGFNHPTAIVMVKIDTNYKRIWCKELLYESYLTTDDVIQRMKQMNIADYKMFCDSAEPKTIESLRRAGFDANASMKEVKAGIDCVKSYKLFVHKDSTNIHSELRRYKWVMKGEIKTDEPIRLFDDALCAIRYATYTYTYKTAKSNAYEFDMDFIDL